MNQKARGPGRPPKVGKEAPKADTPPKADEEPKIALTQKALEDIISKAVQTGRDDERTTRDQESRAEEVHEPYDDVWEEPLLLDATHIKPRAEMEQRWMRTMIAGDPDESNIARYLNKGWKPRQVESIPEGTTAPQIGFRGHGSVVGVHGMVLMERDAKTCERERRACKARTKAQLEAVDNSMMRDAPTGRGVEGARVDKRKSTITRGRAPSVPD